MDGAERESGLIYNEGSSDETERMESMKLLVFPREHLLVVCVQLIKLFSKFIFHSVRNLVFRRKTVNSNTGCLVY